MVGGGEGDGPEVEVGVGGEERLELGCFERGGDEGDGEGGRRRSVGVREEGG